MCGIHSRCLLSLLEWAEWHLGRADRDKRDKTEVLGMQTASDEWLLHDRDHQALMRRLHHPPVQHWALTWFGVPLSLLLLLPSPFWSCFCLSGASEASGAGQLSQHPNITRRAGIMWLLHGVQYWEPQESCHAWQAATLSMIL